MNSTTNIQTKTATKVKYLTRLEKIAQLSEEEKQKLAPVTNEFVFRTNDYYDSLIDWSDPHDPLRRLVYPDTAELEDWGELVTSSETDYVVVPGLEHKHQDTALLLVNDVCAAYCRYCFRKRLFTNDNDEAVRDISQGLEYIRQHPEINNVILSGGDPLVMSTRKLQQMIRPLYDIPHVETIRIGTKVPAFNPYRILDDTSLHDLFRECATHNKRMYVMSHFSHAKELSLPALQAIDAIYESGARMWNQTPLLRGINDDVESLSDLFHALAAAGVPPYYVYVCRPTAGNKPYVVPIEKGYDIFLQAKFKGSGLVKSARMIMTPKYGKLEILGRFEDKMMFKFHHSANPANEGKIFAFKSNPDALWFSDYAEVKNGSFDY